MRWLPWLAAAVLALPAAAPLFGPGLIGAHRYGDSPFLIVRTLAVLDALRRGTVFPRWSPELAYGLGYPLFDFYGSLAFYGTALLALAGMPTIAAIKAVQLGGFVFGAVAMFALARRHLGEPAGLVAAAAYAYAPYHLVNVYARGDSLGEFTALALLPAVLLAVEAAAEGKLGGALAFGVLAAGLVLAHNLSALLALPLLALWTLWTLARRWTSDRQDVARGTLALALGGVLALGLSAFYWLPALADRRYVHFEHNTTGYFDFHNHFLDVTRLVQASPVYDYALSGSSDGALPFQLGLVQALAAALGVILAALLARRVSVVAALAASTGLGYAALATPLARPIWELLPPLQIAQFPWRALGPASLGLALMAGMPLTLLRGRTATAYASAVVGLVVMGGSLGANPGRWRIAAEELNAGGSQRYEYLTSSIGSTVRYEYLPNQARERPWTSSYVLFPGDDAVRLLPGQPAEVRTATRRGMGFVVDVRVAQAGPVVFEHYYFPGWRAMVDGEPAAVWPSEPEGYLTVGLPGGDHRVELAFGETRLRTYADVVSIASAALLLFTVATWARRRSPGPESPERGPTGRVGPAAAVVVGAVVVFAARLPWADMTTTVPRDGLDHRFGGVHAPWAVEVPGGVQVGPSYVVGYRQPDAVEAGRELRLELAQAASGGRLVARLISPAELIGGASRAVATAETDTARGTVGLTLPVPAGTPPGLYQVELSSPGAATEAALLAPIRVGSPSAPPASGPTLANFGGEVALEGIAPSAGASAANPRMELRWRALRLPTSDWRVSLRLVDEAGHNWAASDGRPADGFFPTRYWSAGQTIAEIRDLIALAGTPPGRYRLEVRLYSLAGRSLDVVDARGAALGASYRSQPIDLAPGPAPSPPPADAAALSLAQAVVGAHEVGAGAPFPLALLWRAGHPPGRDLDLVISFGGATVRRPVGGAYPLSRWRPGEVVREILDVRSPRTLATGEYPLTVSVEDPTTGRRVLDIREVGRVAVKNRPRATTLPALQHRLGARFGDGIELAGWTIEPGPVHPGGKVGLTLYWRALKESDVDYTVFTHLLDAQQRVRGQVDAQPGGGSLPTGGWAAGEVIEDRYQIPLDAAAGQGRYDLEVGLYDARSGQRLPVTLPDGTTSDRVVLTSVVAAP